MSSTFPPIITIITVAGITLVHGGLMVFHKTKMGSDRKDNPKDRSWLTANLIETLFAILTALMAVLAVRRSKIALDAWNPSNWIEHTANFLPLPATDETLVGGALIFVAGAYFRIWSIHVLGRFFTFQIGIRDSHRIIEEGPYKYLRHPSYTGYLVMLVGAGVAYGSLFLIVGALPVALAFLWMRMNDEEKMLLQHFGPSYEAYMRRTRRLVPFIY